MTPGELLSASGNTGDRPMQVGSHDQHLEINSAQDFNRDAARRVRLTSLPGTAAHCEPNPRCRVGEQLAREAHQQ